MAILGRLLKTARAKVWLPLYFFKHLLIALISKDVLHTYNYINIFLMLLSIKGNRKGSSVLKLLPIYLCPARLLT